MNTLMISSKSLAEKFKRRNTDMGDKIEILGDRIREDVGEKTRKRKKNNEMEENEQGMLTIPRGKAWGEDTDYLSRGNMTLKSVDLERMWDMILEIIIHTYTKTPRYSFYIVGHEEHFPVTRDW